MDRTISEGDVEHNPNISGIRLRWNRGTRLKFLPPGIEKNVTYSFLLLFTQELTPDVYTSEVLLSTDIEARIGILLACFLAAATNNPISQQVLIDAGLRLPDDLFCDSWQSYIVRVDAMKLSRHTSNSTQHISNAILQQTR